MEFQASTLWWVLAGVLVIAELLTGTFYLLMLALGSVAAAVAAHAGATGSGQFVAAALVGGGATAVWHFKRARAPRSAPAASNADVAVILVDAARGVRPQTFRHLTVCALMGVTSIIIAVNKMDLVSYEHATFEEISGQVKAAAARLGIDEVMTIPVSAVAAALT